MRRYRGVEVKRYTFLMYALQAVYLQGTNYEELDTPRILSGRRNSGTGRSRGSESHADPHVLKVCKEYLFLSAVRTGTYRKRQD
jgi:hypothetical protein